MSRIGRKPITIPAGVEVTREGADVVVKGPKGTLKAFINPAIGVEIGEGVVNVTRPSDEDTHRALHGLSRTLIANMVEGVTNGYKRELEIQGIGYRAQKQGTDLVMNLGFSHQVIVPETETIKIEVPAPNKIVVSGPSKQEVGAFAAMVRSKRPPEPYHGKGIRYAGEVVILKEGKAGKGGKK